MNAVEYVTQEATSFGYCGKLLWSDKHNGMVATDDNFAFMKKRIFTETEVDDIQEGRLLAGEIARQAAKLEKALIKNAYAWLREWDFRLSRYTAKVVFGAVTCSIYLTHSKTGAGICLDDVYFSHDGEILQAVVSL